MHAAVFKGPDLGFAIEEVPDPAPKPHEIILRVNRCGICGTDLHLTDGKGFLQVPAGTVLGHEFAGEVVAVGSDVAHFAVGDHATALAAIAACGQCEPCSAGELQWCISDHRFFPETGGYAQYAPVAEPQAVKLPTSLSLADAALVEPLAVAWHGYRLAELSPGADVLVVGAGPIGLSVAFWARRMGARKVVVQAQSRRREVQALAMGADAFVTSGNFAAGAGAGEFGGSPDVVFEAVGAPGAIELAMQAVRPRGTVMVLGWCGVPDAYTPALYLMKEIRVQFSMTYSVSDFIHSISVLDRGDIDPRAMITETIGLSDLPNTFNSLRAGADQCKVLVDPWRDC